MKKAILSIAILSISLISFAQAPGFMGKTWAIKYDFHIIPSLSSFPNSLENPNSSFLTMFHELNLSKDVSTNMSIYFTYGGSKGERPGHILVEIPDYQDSYDNYSEVEDYFHHTQHALGFGLRFFRSKWLAPVGVYSQVAVSFVSTRAFSDNYGAKTSTTTIKGTFGIGAQRMISESFLIDIGYSVNFNLVSPLVLLDDKTDFNSTLQRSMFLKDIFYLKIGLGFVF
jgi:hypothetical protein